MNRTKLLALLTVAALSTFLMLGNALAGPEVDAVRFAISEQSSQMIDACHRLICHSKAIVIESLTIAKQSISLAIDIAIKSLWY